MLTEVVDGLFSWTATQHMSLLSLFATKNTRVTKNYNQETHVPSLISCVISLCGIFSLVTTGKNACSKYGNVKYTTKGKDFCLVPQRENSTPTSSV